MALPNMTPLTRAERRVLKVADALVLWHVVKPWIGLSVMAEAMGAATLPFLPFLIPTMAASTLGGLCYVLFVRKAVRL